jgi:hypothetical protein
VKRQNVDSSFTSTGRLVLCSTLFLDYSDLSKKPSQEVARDARESQERNVVGQVIVINNNLTFQLIHFGQELIDRFEKCIAFFCLR